MLGFLHACTHLLSGDAGQGQLLPASVGDWKAGASSPLTAIARPRMGMLNRGSPGDRWPAHEPTQHRPAG
jgi:hypothetical protein